MRAISVFYPTNHDDSELDYSKELKSLFKNYELINLPRKDYSSKYSEFSDLLRCGKLLMAWRGGSVRGEDTANSTVELLFDLSKSDYEYIKSNDIQVIGYSDVTYLLSNLLNNGIVCYYGPNLQSKFIEAPTDKEKEQMQKYMELALFSQEYTIDMFDMDLYTTDKPYTLQGGSAKGRLIGGNLATLFDMQTKFPQYMLKRKSGDILLLEDVDPKYCEENDALEKVEYVETYFQTLFDHGFFEDISALLIGRSKDPIVFGKEVFKISLSPREEMYYLEKVVSKYISKKIPIIANVPCSHTFPMITLPLGKCVEVDADVGIIRIGI